MSAVNMVNHFSGDLLTQGPCGFTREGLAEFYGVSLRFVEARLHVHWREVAYTADGCIVHISYAEEG